MNKVTVKNGEEGKHKPKMGDLYVRGGVYVYIISMVKAGEYSLICLSSGDRWGEPVPLEDLDTSDLTFLGRNMKITIK